MVKKSFLWLYSAVTWLLWASIIVVAVIVLGLRYYILPNIQQYKDTIAQHASQAAGLKITIGDIRASWDGLNPHLDLFKVDLYDAQNRPALTLDHIETSLSWLSLALVEPRLSTLVLHKPTLIVRRETDGTIYVAGISMSGPSRPAFPNWLLRQSQIDVLDAGVLWLDDLRHAPPLGLEKLTLRISSPPWESFRGRHRFGLRATPSAGTSQPIDIRGNLFGKDVSKPEQWRGTVYARMEGTDVAAWRKWITFDTFDLRKGFGATQVWLDISQGQVESLVSDVVLTDVVTTMGEKVSETSLRSLSGRLSWKRLPNGQELDAERINLVSGGLKVQNGSLHLGNRTEANREIVEGSIRVDDVGLEQLATFAGRLPIGEETQQALAEIAPKGRLQHFGLDWSGTPKAVEKFELNSRFSNLVINPYRGVPGFNGMSGSLNADQDGGSLNVTANRAQLDFKDVLRWPIPVEKLSGQAKWKRNDGKLEVKVSNLSITSPHITGTANATYQHSGKGAGILNLTGKFGRVDGRYAHYYYPVTLSKDTLHWLDTSVLSGRSEDVNVIVKGNLDDFPWADSTRGLFQVSARISDALLDYADGWPRVEGLKLGLLFRGNRMELNATDGRLYGNKIIKAKAVIPALDALHPVLELTGELNSPANEVIRFVNNSPVLEEIDHFTEYMEASGAGKLLIGLRIPLDTEGVGSRIKGSYLLSDGTIIGNVHFPTLEHIQGRIDFTENSLRAKDVTAQIFGGSSRFSLENTEDGRLHILAQGRISDTSLQQITDLPLVDKLRGSIDWNGEFNVRKNLADAVLNSNLVGLSSSLPPPFAKGAADVLPLRIEKKMVGEQQDMVNLSLGKVADAKFLRSRRDGAMTIERGEINFGGIAELPPQRGIGLKGSISHFDLDQWQALASGRKSMDGIEINSADLSFGTLDVFGRRINQLRLNAMTVADGWRASLQSREINGDTVWSHSGHGKVVARLTSLIAPSAAPSKLSDDDIPARKDIDYPALDIVAENFEIRQKQLGRLELVADYKGNDWGVDKLVISNADSTLTGNGEWQNWKSRPNTRFNLTWNINDIGKTLERFGYPDTIKGGNADLSGQLKWTGSPAEFNVPGLSGNLKLDAGNGQFLKIKPGVGRLFSVLSLQNLPRRLSFDFRDVFSAGFTFDKISANARIENGVMKSDDFKMEGPTAKVAISGETDLSRETQNLHIKVIPSISDSLSLAALAGGPAVGAAAWVAQKVLKDPLNNLAAYEYDITGTWDDPQEIKSGKSESAPTPAISPLGK